MSGIRCKKDLNNILPNGLLGDFSVKKITHNGRTPDCNVQNNNHLVELELENHSPNPFAVKFTIEVQQKNVKFSNRLGTQIGNAVVIDPPARRPTSWDYREQIEPDVNNSVSDNIELKLEWWKLAMPGSPCVQEVIQVSVN